MLDRAAAEVGERFADQPLVEAAIRQTIGEAYSNLGEYNKGLLHLNRAGEIFERERGKEDADALIAVNAAANVLLEKGDYGKTERVFRELTEVYRRTEGPEARNTMGVMSNLSMALARQQRFDESQQLAEQLLALRREVLGPDHEDTITTMMNLGIVLGGQGHSVKAAGVLREALKIAESSLGPRHPVTILSKANLAEVLIHEGRDAGEAERLLEEALQASGEVFGRRYSMRLAARTFESEQRQLRPIGSLKLLCGMAVTEVTRRMSSVRNPVSLTPLPSSGGTDSMVPTLGRLNPCRHSLGSRSQESGILGAGWSRTQGRKDQGLLDSWIQPVLWIETAKSPHIWVGENRGRNRDSVGSVFMPRIPRRQQRATICQKGSCANRRRFRTMETKREPIRTPAARSFHLPTSHLNIVSPCGLCFL